jgi:hypothetical protein
MAVDLVTLRQNRAKAYDKMEARLHSAPTWRTASAVRRGHRRSGGARQGDRQRREAAEVQRREGKSSWRSIAACRRRCMSCRRARLEPAQSPRLAICCSRCVAPPSGAASTDAWSRSRRPRAPTRRSVRWRLPGREGHRRRPVAPHVRGRPHRRPRAPHPDLRPSNGVKINALKDDSRATGSRWGGVQGYWIGEGDSLTPTPPEVPADEPRAEEDGGAPLRHERDAAGFDRARRRDQRGVPGEFAFMLDDAMFEGTAANAARLHERGLQGLVAKETGQAARHHREGEHRQDVGALPGSMMGDAEWWINQDCFPQLNSLSMSSAPAASRSICRRAACRHRPTAR